VKKINKYKERNMKHMKKNKLKDKLGTIMNLTPKIKKRHIIIILTTMR